MATFITLTKAEIRLKPQIFKADIRKKYMDKVDKEWWNKITDLGGYFFFDYDTKKINYLFGTDFSTAETIYKMFEKLNKFKLETEVRFTFERARLDAISDGKNFIIRENLGFTLYVNCYGTLPAKFLHKIVEENNYKWCRAGLNEQSWLLHGNTGIICW